VHIGKQYPYHCDLWACSSQWWPGFIPRRCRVALPFNSNSGWSTWSLFNRPSIHSEIANDREKVTYSFGLNPGEVTQKLEVFTTGDEPDKYTNFRFTGAAFAGNIFIATGRLLGPRFSFGGAITGTAEYWVGPIPILQEPCNWAVSHLTWAEQGPVTHPYRVGEWICDPDAP